MQVHCRVKEGDSWDGSSAERRCGGCDLEAQADEGVPWVARDEEGERRQHARDEGGVDADLQGGKTKVLDA
jgi:hypothetical protein